MGGEASKSGGGGGGGGKSSAVTRNGRRLSIGSNGGAQTGGARCAASNGNIASLPPATSKMGASNSCNENLLGIGLNQPADTRSRSGSGSAGTPNKPKKSPIAQKNRQLIQSCFQNPHENLGKRILKRTAEKRKDFARFYFALNSEQKDDVEETIKTLLKKCVANIEFIDEVQRLANEFGAHFVKFRPIGFKADYFSSIGDATITECVFLDNAVHQAHQTLSAFSQFITMLLSSVRDGFYTEMKRMRRTSNSFSTGSNGSNANERKHAPASCDVSPRSASPAAESLNNGGASSASDSEQQHQKQHEKQQTNEADQENKKQQKQQQQQQQQKEAAAMKADKDGEKKPEDGENGKPIVAKQMPEEQKLTRQEAASACSTVVKAARTVTFQATEFSTKASSASDSSAPEKKPRNDDCSENVTTDQHQQQQQQQQQLQDDGCGHTERTGDVEEAGAKAATDGGSGDKAGEEMVVEKTVIDRHAAIVTQSSNSSELAAPQKSFLPPSMAAFFEPGNE